jgi:hypothetical protein
LLHGKLLWEEIREFEEIMEFKEIREIMEIGNK